MILPTSEYKGTDQTARMRRLVCALIIRQPPKTGVLDVVAHMQLTTVLASFIVTGFTESFYVWTKRVYHHRIVSTSSKSDMFRANVPVFNHSRIFLFSQEKNQKKTLI